MNRRIFSLVLSLGLVGLLAPAATLADDRLASAINHVRNAIAQGKARYASGLAMHADLALEDAEGIEKQKADSHTEEAIVHLKAAIEEGNKNHAEAATKHAEEALHHLELVAR